MHLGRGEHPLFVEHAIVGQVVFQHGGGDLAALQDEIAVEQAAVLQMRPADAKCRPVGAGLGQRLQCGAGGALERRLQDQVLGLVAGQEHLGQCHQGCARRAPRLPGRACLFGIAGQITHGGVQLRQRQSERVGHAGNPLSLTPVLADCRGRESGRRASRAPGLSGGRARG
jgi:hypothetical protein